MRHYEKHRKVRAGGEKKVKEVLVRKKKREGRNI